MSYGLLTGDGCTHGALKHAAKEWSRYDYRSGETFSTNTVEGFWKLFKVSARSTPHSRVEQAHQAYLSEFSFRTNKQYLQNAMFDLLIGAI